MRLTQINRLKGDIMNREEMLARLKKGEDPLELSIEKWEDVVDKGLDADQGWENCALCEKYFPSGCSDPCKGCPIFEKTGKHFCDGTPYEKYQITADEDIAKEEVEFLKSLRKK